MILHHECLFWIKPSQHINVFTSLEAPQRLSDQSFYWNLWPYSPAPSEGELIPQDPKTPLEIRLLNCLVRPAPALNHS